MPTIRYEIQTGEPYLAGDTRITPFARVLRIQLPGPFKGLIWNRPTSVLVKTPDGQEQIIPVRDVTRQAQLALLGIGLLGGLLVVLVSGRFKSTKPR
jgi:hypothetical protein